MGYAFIANALMSSVAHRVNLKALKIEHRSQVFLKRHIKDKSFSPTNCHFTEDNEGHSFLDRKLYNSDETSCTSYDFANDLKSSELFDGGKMEYMVKSIFSKVKIALFQNSAAKSNFSMDKDRIRNLMQFNVHFESELLEKLNSNANIANKTKENANLTVQLKMNTKFSDKLMNEIEPKCKLDDKTIKIEKCIKSESKCAGCTMLNIPTDLNGSNAIGSKITVKDYSNCAMKSPDSIPNSKSNWAISDF